MQVIRYRFDIEPTGAAQTMLARVFDCRRVVFNDIIRTRAEAYRSTIWKAADRPGAAWAGIEDAS